MFGGTEVEGLFFPVPRDSKSCARNNKQIVSRLQEIVNRSLSKPICVTSVPP